MEPVAVKSKTQIVSVLFVDIVGYSKRSVTQQVEIKRAFNVHLGDALSPVLPDDWILLDTGDGAAIAFLNSPEEALLTSDRLMALAYPANSEPIYSLRSGLHLGPVVIVLDVNGSANLVGDAINDAQRIMSFAGEDEVFSSRQYAELVERIDTSYVDRFSSMGYMQDKHGRAHDLARVAPSGYKIPGKFVPEMNGVTSAEASPGALASVVADTPVPAVSDQTARTRALPGMAILIGGVAAIAVSGWLFWGGNKPAEAPLAPALEQRKTEVGAAVTPPQSSEKPPPPILPSKPASSAPSVIKPVQEPKKPATVSSELRMPSTVVRQMPSSMESLDCPQCSCTDLLGKVSRGVSLSAAETAFVRSKCQWQESPQSGGVGMTPSLTKQTPASAPTQQSAGQKPPPSPLPAPTPSKPPEKVVREVRQTAPQLGQTSTPSISECPYCTCPDLLRKASLSVPLSSAETKYLRTKCQ